MNDLGGCIVVLTIHNVSVGSYCSMFAAKCWIDCSPYIAWLLFDMLLQRSCSFLDIAANMLHWTMVRKNHVRNPFGKQAAAVANNHLRDDTNSSVEEINRLKHVPGDGKQEHNRVTKAKMRSQICVHLIQDSDDKLLGYSCFKTVYRSKCITFLSS